MTKNELKTLIEAVVDARVKATVKQYLKHYVPMMIGEAVSEMVDDKLEVLTNIQPKAKAKAKKLNEIFEMDESDLGDVEFRTLGNKTLSVADRPKISNKSKISAMLGYGQPENIITSVISDAGVEIPIDPEVIPEHITNALNKDYSGFLKKMNEKK